LFPSGWDSSVGVANRYGMDGPGIEYRRFYTPITNPASYKAGRVNRGGKISRTMS